MSELENHPGAGRYAPSPSGDLHFGNLRTALIAWLMARGTGRDFRLRIEDIDTQRSSATSAQRQIEDLLSLGMDFDGAAVYQSDRFPAYESALAQLAAAGLVYECYCSRREIHEAARAPHLPPGSYPGTCRDMSAEQRRRRREDLQQQGRVPALRLRAEVDCFTIEDLLHGSYTGEVDDFVLRRGGNAGQGQDWAYNFAVVIDDGFQGIDQVVRGDDLLESAPRQGYLAELLGIEVPTYVHVPLVLNDQGQRLAKRDGAVTLAQLQENYSTTEILGMLAASLGYPEVDSAAGLLAVFDLRELSREPMVWSQPG